MAKSLKLDNFVLVKQNVSQFGFYSGYCQPCATFQFQFLKFRQEDTLNIKCTFLASIYTGKFRNLNKIFNKFERTKCQTIDCRGKIIFFLLIKIIMEIQ